jgi:hypothetical protein
VCGELVKPFQRKEKEMRKNNNKSTGSKRKKQAKSSLLEKLDKSSLVKELEPKEVEKVRGGNRSLYMRGLFR